MTDDDRRMTGRSVTITIPGEPVSKARPRFGHGHAHTPDKTKQATIDAGKLMRAACPDPIEGPVAVKMWFYHRPPKGWAKKRWAELDMIGNAWKTTKPDVDNLAKLILDAGNGILWWDDVTVVRLTAQKEYAANARTVVEVASLRSVT